MSLYQAIRDYLAEIVTAEYGILILIESPDMHDFSEDGVKEVSLEDFLYEVGEKLILLGIL